MARIIVLSVLCVFQFQFSANASEIIVLGDIQLAPNISIRQYPKLSAWKSQRIDVNEFQNRINDLKQRERPNAILQVGDLVNLNNSSELWTTDSTGHIRVYPQAYDEWKTILSYFSDTAPLFPAIGNHERYGKTKFTANIQGDEETLKAVKLDSISLSDSARANERLNQYFPKLLKTAEILPGTGTYFVNNSQFCLLSFDGMDLDRGKETIQFMEKSFKNCRRTSEVKPLLVITHYPVFSGRAKSDEPDLMFRSLRKKLVSLFNKYRADFVFSGHEHFYLRYKPAGLEKAGYGEYVNSYSTYMTVSDFANPYKRKVKRISEDPSQKTHVTFYGTHYAKIKIAADQIIAEVYGYESGSKKWRLVDKIIRKRSKK